MKSLLVVLALLLAALQPSAASSQTVEDRFTRYGERAERGDTAAFLGRNLIRVLELARQTEQMVQVCKAPAETYCRDVLEHTDDPVRTHVCQCCSLLNQGGIINIARFFSFSLEFNQRGPKTAEQILERLKRAGEEIANAELDDIRQQAEDVFEAFDEATVLACAAAHDILYDRPRS